MRRGEKALLADDGFHQPAIIAARAGDNHQSLPIWRSAFTVQPPRLTRDSTGFNEVMRHIQPRFALSPELLQYPAGNQRAITAGKCQRIVMFCKVAARIVAIFRQTVMRKRLHMTTQDSLPQTA